MRTAFFRAEPFAGRTSLVSAVHSGVGFRMLRCYAARRGVEDVAPYVR